MKASTIHRLVFCILGTALMLLAGACQKEKTPEASEPVEYLYAGNQGDNQFQLWIWIYEDPTIPARVHSGICRYIDNHYVDTDIEHLSCRLTEDGFTLSDPGTGKDLYTATIVDKDGLSPWHIVHVSWNHSPGAAWDTYAEEKGWKREMNLEVQICEGDDIIDY